ncbi:MAG: reverse transcriptase domain-containing protein, partial [Sedimenticola sp.]
MIHKGVDVHEFFVPFKGCFKGQAFNSDLPPMKYFPNASICKGHVSFVVNELCEGLRSGALRLLGKVGECTLPKVIMPLTVEPSKPRLCHDERYLNLWIKNSPFQLETLRDVHRLVGKSSLMVACDEKSGYSHIRLSADSQTYFGIQFGGWVLCYTVLPFGWKGSSFIYQTVGMQVTSYLRSFGMLTTQYIDDRMAATAVTSDQLSAAASAVSCIYDATVLVYALLEVLSRLGYTLSLEKSQLIPSTCIKFLGFFVDSEKQAYILPSDKKDKFISLREYILSQQTVDLRTLQRFAGKCISMYLVIPAAKLYSRATNSAISVCIKNNRHVAVEADLRQELEYWRFLDTWRGHATWQPEVHKQLLLVTDASSFRYGAAILSGDMLGGTFGDFWTPHDKRPIHLKEADAVVKCLQSLESQIQDTRVDLWTDNMAVVHAWTNQGSRDPLLNTVMKMLFDVVARTNTNLHLKYIRSADNPADRPSRAISFTECMLHDRTWSRVETAFGPHTVDLMAIDSNVMRSPHGTPLRHFTPAPAPNTNGVNVFAQD